MFIHSVIIFSACDLLLHPIFKAMHIESNVLNRFASTVVTHVFENPNSVAQEVSYTLLIPEKSFVKGLEIVINGKSYKSMVKEAGEAKTRYDEVSLIFTTHIQIT